MKKLIVVLFFLVTNVYSQNNFILEWETSSDFDFVGITSLEQNNAIPEIICRSSDFQSIYVLDGATKQLKYTYTDSDTSDFTTYAKINSQPIDINNDGIFEIISEKKNNYAYVGGPGPYYKLRVLNGADGQTLYEHTWDNCIGELQQLDIDGDGYTEICIRINEQTFPDYRSRLLILSTTSHPVGIKSTNYEVDSYELKQNYPNPFNPDTKIEYTLSKSADVRLIIYDIKGEEITSLVNEMQNAGTYIKNLNGRNLASGTYFYQLSVNGIPESKKMILIK
jgi:hypothetical protein